MNLTFPLIVVTLLFPLFFSWFSHAMTEKLGKVELTDVLIKPYFELKEPQEGGFYLGESSMQLTWFVENYFQSKLRIGPKSLLNQMARFEDADTDELGLVEAYGQFATLYGQVRVGMIPLRYGAEGSLSESELFFSRHLLFQNRTVALRDMGFEYSIQHNGFYSDIKVHNGEGESNTDGRMWVTANWGWKDRNKLQVGLAGLTGTTKPVSTSSSNDVLANVNVNEEALWRMGTLFFRWYPSEWKMLMEVTFGEVVQGKDDVVQGRFSGGHVDAIYDTKRWAAMTRWQYFEPSSQSRNDLQRQVSIGFILKNKSQTGMFKVIGSKIIEDGMQQANDELRLVWQFTPLVTTY